MLKNCTGHHLFYWQLQKRFSSELYLLWHLYSVLTTDILITRKRPVLKMSTDQFHCSILKSSVKKICKSRFHANGSKAICFDTFFFSIPNYESASKTYFWRMRQTRFWFLKTFLLQTRHTRMQKKTCLNVFGKPTMSLFGFESSQLFTNRQICLSS